jgi:hypothetical protein
MYPGTPRPERVGDRHPPRPAAAAQLRQHLDHRVELELLHRRRLHLRLRPQQRLVRHDPPGPPPLRHRRLRQDPPRELARLLRLHVLRRHHLLLRVLVDLAEAAQRPQIDERVLPVRLEIVDRLAPVHQRVTRPIARHLGQQLALPVRPRLGVDVRQKLPLRQHRQHLRRRLAHRRRLETDVPVALAPARPRPALARATCPFGHPIDCERRVRRRCARACRCRTAAPRTRSWSAPRPAARSAPAAASTFSATSTAAASRLTSAAFAAPASPGLTALASSTTGAFSSATFAVTSSTGRGASQAHSSSAVADAGTSSPERAASRNNGRCFFTGPCMTGGLGKKRALCHHPGRCRASQGPPNTSFLRSWRGRWTSRSRSGGRCLVKGEPGQARPCSRGTSPASTTLHWSAGMSNPRRKQWTGSISTMP